MEMEKLNLNIIRVFETSRINKKEFISDNYRIICAFGGKIRVGLILDEDKSKCVLEYSQISNTFQQMKLFIVIPRHKIQKK